MGRLLRRTAECVALCIFLLGGLVVAQPAAGSSYEVSNASTFKQCFERLPSKRRCVVTEDALERTVGTAALDAIFSATLPTASAADIDLIFEKPGCLIWNHQASFPGNGEPANTVSPVKIMRLTAPAGTPAGTRVRVVDPCIEERRDGVAGGSASTVVQGIVLEGAGAANVTLTVEDTNHVQISSTGAGSALVSGFTVKSRPSVINVVDYGTVADGVTDDAPAINAALTAACALPAATARKVYLPAGTYGIGQSGATGKVYSGIKVECDDVHLFGDGPATQLNHLGNNGHYLIYVCSSLTDDAKTCTTTLTNVTISDLWLEDPNPIAHGHSVFELLDEGTLTVGTPAFADTVTWSGDNTGTGTVAYYAGGQIGIVVATGTLNQDDAVTVVETGSAWTATGATVVEDGTSEESHGIGSSNVDGFYIRNINGRSISDETIDLQLDSKNVFVSNVDLRECGQLSSGGSCIAIQEGSEVLVSNSYFSGGTGTVSGASAAVIAIQLGAASTISATFDNIIAEETSTTDAEVVDAVLAIAGNNVSGAIELVAINNSVLRYDRDNTRAGIRSDAIQATGLAPSTTLIANSRIEGNIYKSTATPFISVVNSDLYAASTASGYAWSIDTMIGGSAYLDKFVAAMYALLLQGDAILNGVKVYSKSSCVQLFGTTSAQIVNNWFSCGEGSSGSAYVVRELSGADWTYVAGNYVFFYDSSGTIEPMAVGSGGADEVMCDRTAGTGTNSICDETTNRGDTDPAP